MRCPHCEHEIVGAVRAIPTVGGSSAEAQEAVMVEALRAAGAQGLTTDDFRAAGCYQVSARIWSLRDQGFKIDTELYSGIGADGCWHARMARYRLVSEPLALEAVKARRGAKSGARDANGEEATR